MSVSSTSSDSRNQGSKIFKGKTFLESSKKQNLNLPCTGNYLHSVYIVLEIISGPKMTLSVWKGVHGLYANTMPFHVRHLNICGFGIL